MITTQGIEAGTFHTYSRYSLTMVKVVMAEKIDKCKASSKQYTCSILILK